MIFRFLAEVRAPALAAALLALPCAGCNPTFEWVGTAFDQSSGNSSDVVAAITVRDGEVRAYLCGGPTTYNTLSRWYDGRVDGSNSYYATTDEGSTVQGYVSGSYAYGDFATSGGASFFVEGNPVEDDLSGLYAVEDDGCLTGVVVIDNGGGEPFVQGTWCDDQGRFAQVTPVTPFEKTDRGIHVQVDLSVFGTDEVRDLYVTKDAVR